MRPTRWTRQRRITYYGKGGWHLRTCLGYTNPVTGHGVNTTQRRTPWALLVVLRMRREQERELRDRR